MGKISPEIIKKIEQSLSSDKSLERFKGLLYRIDQPFIYYIDENNEEAKLLKNIHNKELKIWIIQF